MNEVARLAIKVVAPALYVGGFFFTIAATYTLIFSSPVGNILGSALGNVLVGSIVLVLLIGAVVFGFVEAVLMQAEGLQRPTVWDHLRRCALLYLILVPVVFFLVSYLITYLTAGLGTAPGAWFEMLLALVSASLGLLINALALIRRRRHFELNVRSLA